MPTFEHTSTYPQSRSEVFAWHTRPGAFVRLTPPGTAEVTQGPTDGIREGSRFTLRLSAPLVAALGPSVPLPGLGSGPLGVPWRVVHSEFVEGERFVDEQESGPWGQWRHEHIFDDTPEGGTRITDRVTWQAPGPLSSLTSHGPLRTVVETALRELFTYRTEQLRADLALHARASGGPLTVAVSGSTGLIGTQVRALLTSGGHRVVPMVRGDHAEDGQIAWTPGERLDPGAFDGVDAVVNLAGAPIAGRFTDDHKKAVLRSRLDSTTTICRAIREADDAPRAIVQASAIGFYGPRRPGELLSEDSGVGAGFLADVVRQWEGATLVDEDRTRAVWLRTGIVLTPAGGALPPQLPLFRMGVGGRLTDPDSHMSWISLDDMARSYVWALTHEVSGPYNAVADHPVTSAEFAETLGRVLHRPSAVPVPRLGPTAVLGRQGADEFIETDQNVSSARLRADGFEMTHPRLEQALRHVLLRHHH